MDEFDSITEEFESGDQKKMIKKELVQDFEEEDLNQSEFLKERIAFLMNSKSSFDKITLLPLLTTLLSKKNHKIQSQSVDLGILGVAAMWLKPLRDGTLPDEIIRTSILQSLTTEFNLSNLPQPDMSSFKHQVVETGLATAVSKLSDYPNETESNKKIVKDLLINWMHYFYYNNNVHTNTSSNTCRKPMVHRQVQRKIKETGGLGVKDRIEKRIRQLHYSTHRKSKCTLPTY